MAMNPLQSILIIFISFLFSRAPLRSDLCVTELNAILEKFFRFFSCLIFSPFDFLTTRDEDEQRERERRNIDPLGVFGLLLTSRAY
jgi:hypothetical protein